MNKSECISPGSNDTFKKAFKETLKGNEVFVREQQFRLGWSKETYRNKKTGSVYQVSVDGDGYLFEPMGNSRRKPFHKPSLDDYEKAGTGLN